MSVRRAVDQAALARWAELSGDRNPIHVDPVYAAGTRFEGTILHGHLTVAWLMEQAQAAWGTETWARSGSLSGIRYRLPLRPDVAYDLSTQWTNDETLLLAVITPAGERAVEATARLATGGVEQ